LSAAPVTEPRGTLATRIDAVKALSPPARRRRSDGPRAVAGRGYKIQPVVTSPSTLRAKSAALSPFTSSAMVVRLVSAE
jgi:hypothetical protein